jgi:hypothetical protein
MKYQEDIKIKWNLAKTAYEREGVNCSRCNICGELKNSRWVKVFHNVRGYDYWDRNEDGSIERLNHINICEDCNIMIPRGWIGCRCNK